MTDAGLEAPTLTPTQSAVLDQLGSAREDRPTFDPGLVDELRAELTDHLKPLAAEVTDPPLFVAKRRLADVHGCEARYLAPDPFAWSVPAARGTVAHKALELHWGWRGETTSLDLVEGAMARLEADDRFISDYLRGLDEAARADLVSQANDTVASFLEDFPPIKRQWHPVAESRVRAEFADGAIVLSGKVDLTIGRAQGPTAGKVLIDLKTGGARRQHIDDLRFYALLDTLRIGTPPRLLVNYHLDQGRPQTEAVTEDLLWTTVRRVVDAATKMIELAALDREPTRTVGPNCRWCPLLDECEGGQAHLADQDW